MAAPWLDVCSIKIEFLYADGCTKNERTMALKLLNLQTIIEKHLIRQCPSLTITRFGHRLRGKPPGVALSLEQRLNGEFCVSKFCGYVPFPGIGFQPKNMWIQKWQNKLTLVFHKFALHPSPQSVRNDCHTQKSNDKMRIWKNRLECRHVNLMLITNRWIAMTQKMFFFIVTCSSDQFGWCESELDNIEWSIPYQRRCSTLRRFRAFIW